MNRKKFPTPCFGFGRLTAIATLTLCLAATSAEALEKTYRFYRFVTIGMKNDNDTIQLGEFTFSLNGTVLNTNNRNGDNADVVPVVITAGEQDPEEFEGPAQVSDGDLETKWLKYLPFGEAEALTFEFESPVTIDSYNWGSGNDSVGYSRSPISWQFEGSSDGLTWDVLDIRFNYPIQNEDLTYQAGFAIPEVFPPAILRFNVDTTSPLGSAGIVLNGSPVSLAWDTVFADDVSISPAPGAVDPSGTVAVTPPANSTLAYALTAGSTGVTETATSTVNVRTVTGGEATYQFVRFTATKLGNGTPDGFVQLAEFTFVNDGEAVEVSAVSNPGGFSFDGEGVENLIDGDGVGNKWLDLDNAPVIFDFGQAKTFDGYSFYTANDAPDRDPIQWTLEGSNDETTWTRIEDVNFDYPTPALRNVSSREIPLPGPSLVVRLNSFTGSSQTLVEGEPLVLSWSVDAAASIEIDQGVGAVSPGEGSIVVTPSPAVGETTYTLTASSLGGTVTGTFTVNVIPTPEITTIAYDDFGNAGDELSLRGSTTIFGNVLRLTPDEGGQMGEAWFRLRQPVADGFEATFGMSMNQDEPNGIVSADGLAFVIQNSPEGSDSGSNGENGVATNALNIKFKSFGFSPFEASQLQVLAGTTVLDTRSIDLTPGTMLHGLPAGEGGGPFPYTLGSPAGKAPYQIRIVYVPGSPGHLDIYFDGIAIIQNLDVDLAEIGAVDANGDAFVGFSARTGGNVQNNDITGWKMAYGDFSALPPFGLVKANYRRDYSGGAVGVPVFDLVWNAEDDVSYEVQSSPDLTPESWTTYGSYDPFAGQIGVRLPVTESRMFYRVVEVE